MNLYNHLIRKSENKFFIIKPRKYYFNELIIELILLILYFCLIYYNYTLGFNYNLLWAYCIFILIGVIIFFPRIIILINKVIICESFLFDFTQNKLIINEVKENNINSIKKIVLKPYNFNINFLNIKNNIKRYKVIFFMENNKKFNIISSDTYNIFYLINEISEITKIDFLNETILINPKK